MLIHSLGVSFHVTDELIGGKLFIVDSNMTTHSPTEDMFYSMFVNRTHPIIQMKIMRDDGTKSYYGLATFNPISSEIEFGGKKCKNTGFLQLLKTFIN